MNCRRTSQCSLGSLVSPTLPVEADHPFPVDGISMILCINLRDDLPHRLGVRRFPGLYQPVLEGAVVPRNFFQPLGITVEKIIGQVALLL